MKKAVLYWRLVSLVKTDVLKKRYRFLIQDRKIPERRKMLVVGYPEDGGDTFPKHPLLRYRQGATSQKATFFFEIHPEYSKVKYAER
jgi:hypothetical protein